MYKSLKYLSLGFLICEMEMIIPHRASLVAQMVKNLPAMQETGFRCLGQEDPLKKGMATHSSCLENPMDRGSWRAIVHGAAKSQTGRKD